MTLKTKTHQGKNINENNIQFFKKKSVKLRKKEMTQIIKIKNERRDITKDFTDTKKIL